MVSGGKGTYRFPSIINVALRFNFFLKKSGVIYMKGKTLARQDQSRAGTEDGEGRGGLGGRVS